MHEIPPIIERLATDFERATTAVPGAAGVRMLITADVLVPYIVVYVTVAVDGAVELVELEVDLLPPSRPSATAAGFLSPMSSAGGGVTFSSPTDSATSRAARLFTSRGRLLDRSGMTSTVPLPGDAAYPAVRSN